MVFVGLSLISDEFSIAVLNSTLMLSLSENEQWRRIYSRLMLTRKKGSTYKCGFGLQLQTLAGRDFTRQELMPCPQLEQSQSSTIILLCSTRACVRVSQCQNWCSATFAL